MATWQGAGGRLLGEPVNADRPSPACDVSAMDGFAIRLSDPLPEALPVVGEARIGVEPVPLPAGAALRIFTGSPIPEGADCVVPLEKVSETAQGIGFRSEAPPAKGDNIRLGGENCRGGASILREGQAVTPATAAALAAFAPELGRIRRMVRVCAIVTGSEIRPPGADVASWQVRDSNGPAVQSLVQALPWAEWGGTEYVRDDRAALTEAFADRLAGTDALILSGGVSVGNYDFVPEIVASTGCELIFQWLRIRPGKPVLGAVGPEGQAIIGLPGNPVAALVALRRFVLPALRRLAGFAYPDPPVATVKVDLGDSRARDLFWYRPVRMETHGEARLVKSRGSADLVSAARSDGFVELPPRARGEGRWPYFPWGNGD